MLFHKRINNPIINILTRTSGRPIGFKHCRQSILEQTYKKINHCVVTDCKKSINYIINSGVINFRFIDRNKIIQEDKTKNKDPKHGILSPHNLYCNVLNKMVVKGFIMYLDDDDMLLHENAIEEIVNCIRNSNTMLFWQMRYPNGKLLPIQGFIKEKPIIADIGSPCFLFHKKWIKYATWDTWKCADFRVIESLYQVVPNKIWIKKPYIQLNNHGDFGRKNDIKKGVEYV